MKRVMTVEGEGPISEVLVQEVDEREIGVSLTARKTKLEELQEKLYAKAKVEPAFRFYALYDKVYRKDILAEAYRKVKSNRGAAGVDGQTFADIEAYGEEKWLGVLETELRDQTYKPQAVRRVLIPKQGGGERALGIPTIRDRVAQQAAKFLLEPIFEADMMDGAYGYRTGRNAHQAVAKIQQEVRRGKTQVVDADLSKYFDTIPHAELMTSVARRVADTAMLHLIKMWLKVPVQVESNGGGPKMTGGKQTKVGTPQGGVISPLLANVYINRLLKAFTGNAVMDYCDACVVNYADDFVVLTRRNASAALEQIRIWLRKLGLTLNEEKTSLCDAQVESFRFLGYQIGPMANRRTGKKYIGAQPSSKAKDSIRTKVSEILRRERSDRWPVIRDELNQVLRGWGAYYSFGYPGAAYRSINGHVAERVRNFLRRRHRRPNCTKEFGWRATFGKYGVHQLLEPSYAARRA